MTDKDTPPGNAAAPANSGQTLRQRAEVSALAQAALTQEQLAAQSPAELRRMLHELHVHQIELEMQNEELRRAHLELGAARTRYFDLYDLAPVGYCTVSEPGLILEANFTAAGLLGVARGALVKQPLTRFIFPEDQDLYRQHRKRLFATGETQALELRMLGHDRKEFWACLEATAAPGADGTPELRCVLSDITERRQAQHLLAWEKSALEQIGVETSLHEILDGLMLGLEKQLPGALCSILLLDADGVHLRLGAAPSLPPAYNRAICGITIGPAVGSCGTAAYLKRQVIVSDIGSDPLWAAYRELALSHGLHACWSTPILCSRESLLGTFAIYFREPRHPIPSDLELLARAVHVACIAIERKQAEESLRDREKLLRAITDGSEDMIFIKDRDSRLLFLNPAGCRLFGLPLEQVSGHTDAEIQLHPGSGQAAAFVEMDRRVMAAGRSTTFEEEFITSDGERHILLTAKVPRFDDQGNVIGIIGISRDITERKRAEEEIRQLNGSLEQRVRERTAELETSNKELETFSYSVSHDLRSPLRAVDGFARMLLDDNAEQLDDDGRRMLGVICGEAQRMGRLIDDLLAFSRLGRQQTAPVTINMHALAQGVFDELAALNPGRKLRLDLHPLPPARGTPALIRQVWVNLIDNAIKFTQEREVGEIEIATREGEGGGPVYFIKDNGAGFDMRHAGKLFGVFQRLHGAEEFPGAGVGLALVQRIVQRHGGRVWAEAKVGRGSTFYFTIPNPKP